MVSLKRKGDENIGKIIVFSLTILIAIGFVATATYFYNTNKEKAIVSSIVFDPASTADEVERVTGNTYTGSVVISYDALNSTYTADWRNDETAADADETADAVQFANDLTKTNVATDIVNTTAGTVKYKTR